MAESLLQSIIAGGLAGVIEISFMYPTDVAKTRAQLSTTPTTMLRTLADVLKNEGIVGLYRGVMSPITAEAPKRATKFAANDQFMRLLRKPDGSLPTHRAGMAGALAGTTEALINCPFETIKVRMQAKENLTRYKNTWDCARQVLRQEGALALYNGLTAQIWRNVAWNGTYFAIIGSVRNWMPAKPGDSKVKTLGNKFIAGFIGGASGVVFATPFDVVKSRMQNQLPGTVHPYTSVLTSLRIIAQKEGMGALYKGFGPRLVRLGPGGGIMIVAFDFISSWLKTVMSPSKH
eukprot:m.160312 g.160312  ORF g.160312 m.160312 type:complete len:290 (-) comp16359_c1_seq1:187-1056(-)